MPDWTDVLEARREAAKARAEALAYSSGRLELDLATDPGVALVLVGEAVCCELRALATAVAFEVSDAAREHAGRG
jgi:hypothetical protein